MPIVNIQILEGRTDEQKATLIERVTDAVCESLGGPHEAVRVLIQEVPKTQWGTGGKTIKNLGR